jgi:hypothetical protein
VKEPKGKIRFVSKESLDEHVRDHVIKNCGELWEQLIDATQLAEARREIEENFPKTPMFNKTKEDYERILSGSILRLTREGKWHRHLYWAPNISSKNVRNASGRFPSRAEQTIEALDIDQKIVIIARLPVRKGKFTHYRLYTGYRPCSTLSSDSFRKIMTRRLKKRRCINKGETIANHGFDPFAE